MEQERVPVVYMSEGRMLSVTTEALTRAVQPAKLATGGASSGGATIALRIESCSARHSSDWVEIP
jgi:hypothetical protein